MAPGTEKPINAPSTGPQNDPVHTALDRLRKDVKDGNAVDELSNEQMQELQGHLKEEMQKDRINATTDELEALAYSVQLEVLSGRADHLVAISEAEKTQKAADAEKLVSLYRELKTLASDVDKPKMFSKEWFGETLTTSATKIGELTAAAVVVLDQLRENLAISIGANIDTLRPLLGFLKPFTLGQDPGEYLKTWIGEERIQLSKALRASKITLPTAAFITARTEIETMRRASDAQQRGWSVERTMFEFVRKLKVTGKEPAAVLEQQVKDAVVALKTEIEKDPKVSVDFVDAGKPPETRLNNGTIDGRQMTIMSDGSVVVAGQKWKLKKLGKDVAVSRSEAPSGNVLIEIEEGGARQTLVLTEDLPSMMNALASADMSKNKFESKDKTGTVLIEFVRNPS